jgi:hypothetical protein
MSNATESTPLFAGAAEAAAGSDRPFLLEGTGAWLVRAGRIDVFAVPLEGGEVAGGRTHLCRVEAGGMLFGAGAAAALDTGLLAVGSPGTRVAAVERRQLDAAALNPSAAPALAAVLDEWVSLLCAAIARDVVPDGCAEVAPDGAVPAGVR